MCNPQRCVFVAALLALLVPVLRVSGQCERQWVAGPNGLPGGAIASMVSWDPDGAGPQTLVLVVAGAFTAAADIPVSNIATWDGQTWHALGAGLNGPVFSVAVFNGELYAGGAFTASGATSIHYLAKWSGSAWQEVAFGTDGAVYTLVPNGTELLVGGTFHHVAGTFFPFPYLARYASGNWNGYVNPPGSTVYSVAMLLGQPLVIDYAPPATNSTFSAQKLDRYDGSTWHKVADLEEAGPLGVSGSNVFFSSRQSQTCNDPHHYSSEFHIYQYDGTTVSSSYAFHNASSFVQFSGGFYAVGERIKLCYDGYADNGQAGWIGIWDGNTWSDALAVNDRPDGGTLAVHAGQLYLGGSFTHLGQVQANSIVLLNGSNGGGWTLLVPSFGAIARCAATLNGSEYVGGDFTHAGSVPAAYAAKFNGTAWVGLGNLDGPVTSLGIYAPNPQQLAGLFVSGMFTHSGTTAFSHALLFNPITLGYTPLGSGLDAQARAMVQVSTSFSHADLVIGGDFTLAGGVSAPHIARWNGAAWLTAPFGSGMNSSVLALASYNGQVIAGGSFTLAGGTSHPYLARWDGATWQSLGTGVNGAVRSLAVSNGLLVAGGDFTIAGGTAAGHIAAWNGTSWSPVGPGLDNIVYALTTSGTDLFAGGTFTNAGATPVRHVARWDGTAWNPIGFDSLNPGAGMDDAVLGLATTSGEILAAGAFSYACGQYTPYVTRAPTPGPAEFTSNPAPAATCAGGSASFSVEFDPGGWFVGATFAWYRNGTLLTDGVSSGGTRYAQTHQPTLLLSEASITDAGGYWCIATTGCGQVVSTPTVQLTVGGAGCCAADFNNDGHVNVQDIFDFLSAWFSADPRADFNHVNGIGVQDIFDFLVAWFAGC